MAIEWLIECTSVAAKRLARVLPEWNVPSLPMHAVMSSRLQAACVRLCSISWSLGWRLANDSVGGRMLELIPAFTVFKYQSGAPYQSAEFRKKSAAIYRAAGVPR